MIDEVLTRLDRIEQLLREQKVVKAHYSLKEFADRVGKAEWTCADWARRGRIRAVKKLSGRGKFQAWCVPHEELLRYEKEGLLPEAAR